MKLNPTRAVLVLFLSIFSLLSWAQTLYWVGGSGNFNDPKHWSLSSGGAPANMVPNAGSDVVFDDYSGSEHFKVSITALQSLNSLETRNTFKSIKFIARSKQTLKIQNQLRLNAQAELDSDLSLTFNKSGSAFGLVDLGNVELASNLEFLSGNWDLKGINIKSSNTVSIVSGRYLVNNTIFKTGNLISNRDRVDLEVNQSIFKVENAFSHGPNLNLSSNNSQLQYNDNSSNLAGGNGIKVEGQNNRIIGSGNPVAVCGLTLTGINPLCGAGTNSTGTIFVSIDPTCTGVYTLQFVSGCAPPPTQTVAAGQTYTFTGFASCGTPYQAVIIQGGVPINFSNAYLMLGPTPVVFFPFAQSPPTCFSFCNGSFSSSWTGGTQPLTIIHVPPAQPQTTATGVVSGVRSYTGVCSGVHTFSVTDANGCPSTFTTFLSQPSQLNANAQTTSVTCNSFSNGIFAISPSGGTPNYTVNFSVGAPQSTGPGGTVSSTGLPVGPVSATVTDANNCTFTVSSTINQPSAFVVTPSSTSVSCNGGNNGTASVQVSGATPGYTYLWSPGGATTPSVTGLTAGSKTVVVTDANSCTTSAIFNLPEPSSITLTPTSTNVACNSGTTGAINIAASGGTGAFTFTWVAPGPSTISTGAAAFINTLSAGSYSIFARDANLCTSSVVVNLSQPPAVTITAQTQSITCVGLNNGSATVSVSGGNGGPFTYSWMPGALTTSVITGLLPGTYTATAFDASACPTSTTAIIIQPSSSVTPVSSFTNLSCNQANPSPCNGVITASPTGGTPPYSYTITSGGSPTVAAPPYNNLCAAAYTLDIRDASGCPQQTFVTLSQPPLLVPTLTAPTLPCFNSSVTISASASGGTPGYTLNWTTPTGTATGSSINNQGGGNYTLTVIDINGCSAQTSTNLPTPSSITAVANTPSISCFNVCNATINTTVSGGGGAYTYTWTNAGGASVSNLANPTGMCSGAYTLTIRDAANCTQTISANVLSPTALTLNATSAPVVCFGDSNGSVTLTASGGTPGTPNYTYFIPSANNTGGSFTGLPAGANTATVLDAAGCNQTVSYTIGTPAAPLTATVTGVVGSCNASNGAATVTAAGGNGSFTYTWTPAGGSASVATGLAPGNYSVTVRDASLCSITRTVNIPFIVNISLSLASSSVNCHGASSGNALVTHTGGTAPFSYSWVAPPPTPTLSTQAVSTLSAGVIYTVTVTDAAFCSNSATFQLTQPPAISIATAVTNVSCFGFTNGAISTTLSGGTGALSPTWSPGGITSTSLTNLAAGAYTLNVRDGNLCTASVVVNVNSPSSIQVVFTSTNPTGCISNNGSLCGSASGGSASGYSFTLPGPVTNTTGCFSGLGGGAYNMTVTDGSGCSTNSITTLINPSAPTLAVVPSSVACSNGSTGVITTTASGSGPFTFSMNPVAGSTLASSPAFTVSNLPFGTYFITAIDANSCSTTNSVNVAQAPSLTLNANPSNLLCNGINAGSITTSPAGATPGYTFSWLPAASITTGQGSGTVTGLAAGVYTLNLTDANSCLTQHTFTLTQPTAISVTNTPSNLLCHTVCTGSFNAQASGGTGVLSFSWTASTGSLAGSSSNTIANLCAQSGTSTIIYTLTVSDQNSCTASSTYTLSQPPALAHSITVLNPSCSNSCNAVATQSISGGVPGYTFSWSSSASNSSTLGGLCANTYSGTVTDANGCSSTQGYTVQAPAALTATLSPVNPLCNNACNGSISTTLSGAQGAVSFSWSPAGSGANPSGLCASPNPIYTLVATDANSCQVTITSTLVNPPAIQVSISGTNPACTGGTDGSAAASVTNAIGAVTFTWIPTGAPSQTNQLATNLNSGVVYTVLVADNNSCTASQTVSLIDPPQFSVTTSILTTSCGSSNGAATVNVSGGTPGSPAAYSYTWGPGITPPQGQGTSTVINLAANLYSVLVMDSRGCTTVVSVPINNSNGPVLPVPFSSPVSCFNGANGTASLDPTAITGGNPGYTVSWGPAPTFTNLSNPITGLVAGNYQVRVIDSFSCVSFGSVAIAQPSPVAVSVNSLAPVCNGICDGSIAVTPTGGIAPYTYSWTASLGGSFANTSSLTNLCADTYTLLVGSNSICVDTVLFTFPNQNLITIVPTLTNNACFGDANGAITVTVSGGTSPYTASWSNSQVGFTVNNLSNGSYTVIVVDNQGCQDTLVSNITSAPQLSLSTAVSQPSCGFSNGTATANVNGGSAPYTYTWSTGSNNATVNGLVGGNFYVVSVRDNSLCATSQTILVNNSNGITGSTFAVQPIPCSGNCNGGATVTPQGGNAPISFNWLSPASGTTSGLSNLCPGTYFVQMSDAQNCVRIDSVRIDPLIVLNLSPFINPPTCSNSNGSVNVVVSGGNSPYTFSWSPGGATTSSLTGLNAGTYTLLVTESSTNNCSTSTVINISNPGGPVISSTVVPNLCFGQAQASILALGTSTSGGSIAYQWNTASTQSSLTALNPTIQSVFVLTVTSTNGTVVCATIQSFTLQDPPALGLNPLLVHHPTCFSVLPPCDGSLSAQAFGGVAPYTYTWSNAASGNTLAALCDGSYTLNVQDANGCVVSNTQIVLVSQSNISVTANSFSSSCSSVNDGSITISLSGGVPQYTVNWQGPGSSTFTGTTLSNLFEGEYSFLVTDSLGCTRRDTLAIVPTITIVAVASPDSIICPFTGTLQLNGQSSSGAASYMWYRLDASGSVSVSASPEYTVENQVDPTTYVLVATSSVALCFDNDTVFVDMYPLPFSDAGTYTAIPLDATVQIGGNPTGPTAVSYTWQPAVYLVNPTVANPITSNTFNVIFTVTVQDDKGCISSDTVRVDILPEIYFTNAFSPNGDLKNDIWIIDYMDQFPGSVVEIYNRWGEQLYRSENYNAEPFNGKFKGSDLPVGTYYYIINLKTPKGNKKYTGPLTIFR